MNHQLSCTRPSEEEPSRLRLDCPGDLLHNVRRLFFGGQDYILSGYQAPLRELADSLMKTSPAPHSFPDRIGVSQRIHSSSAHSGNFKPSNVLIDRPHDQLSRWSVTPEPPQHQQHGLAGKESGAAFIMLELEQWAVVCELRRVSCGFSWPDSSAGQAPSTLANSPNLIPATPKAYEYSPARVPTTCARSLKVGSEMMARPSG